VGFGLDLLDDDDDVVLNVTGSTGKGSDDSSSPLVDQSLVFGCRIEIFLSCFYSGREAYAGRLLSLAVLPDL